MVNHPAVGGMNAGEGPEAATLVEMRPAATRPRAIPKAANRFAGATSSLHLIEGSDQRGRHLRDLGPHHDAGSEKRQTLENTFTSPDKPRDER